MKSILNANQVYDLLLDSNIIGANGYISFELANIKVRIDTTDTVGITLQAWLKQWFLENDIYFSEPANTQDFPDFYLHNTNKKSNMLEVKAFKYSRSPAFDIANFESYCASLEQEAYRLDADYIIFGYDMNKEGYITIKKVWLKKIWEITGSSSRFPLKTQVKRDVIYNIRPSINFKNGTEPDFKNKEDLLKAIYETLILYRGNKVANTWIKNTIESYYNYTNQRLEIL
ncbi:NgoBV family restriction endonuclease [Anaerosalibacter massiliensis]|uniref:NgoBV family restriction endonuclease n=1 Tax=Anaerosalibacter massiliensis TaxID=1347392 RepID=A0A9X2MLV1_9FIRM|nr:NgoBV family restriction endonuclease [Anaerosalibacter massiliensis]MCR2043551.1 NgoBV family restriction endonuclease [Anaerosalibacter massiliensis]